MKFDHKRIIVTGASEGIGRALCLLLAKNTVQIIACGRNHERLMSLQQACEELPGTIEIFVGELTEQSICEQLIMMAVEKMQGIDLLINNAGMTMWTLFEEIEDLSIFERLYAVNVLSAVYCTYYALPYLQQSKGMVVAISSVTGLTGVPTRSAYAASKHAMNGFFETLRIEQNKKIDVVIVAPDFVATAIHRRAITQDGSALGYSPLDQSKIMSAERCAEKTLEAIQQKQRLAILSFRGKLVRWLKLFWPSLIDTIARKAVPPK